MSQRCCVFWAASKRPNDQLRCLLSITCEIGGSNQREKARIGKPQRNRVPPGQCEASHIFSNTYETIGAWLGSDVASPYSPDLAPSDYHLFRSLQNFLNGKNSVITMTSNRTRSSFFAVKDQKFYQRKIVKLPERRQKVIEQNGRYLTD